MTTTACVMCEPHGASLERVRFYPRQLITADDMQAEQGWAQQKLRRHNRFTHGWGVCCGFELGANPSDEQPWRVRVRPGYALSPQGDEIFLHTTVDFDMATGAADDAESCEPWPCPPTGGMPSKENPEVYLAIRYAECMSRPERVPGIGCNCDDSICEYSRIRESYELKVLWELPRSHIDAQKQALVLVRQYAEWVADVRQAAGDDDVEQPPPPPTPACPPCPDDPWVVLGRIRLPADPKTQLGDAGIDHDGRKLLISTFGLQTIVGVLMLT